MSRKKQTIRCRFREAVFERDGHKCVFCDETEDLDSHHITDRSLMPNGGYVKENGITLCKWHHLLAENHHSSGGEDYNEGMHPNDLYVIIGSSHGMAYRASEKL